MPEISALRGDEPTEIAGYRLTGRLGSGLYAARSPSGEDVVVRVLPPDVQPEPFLHAIEPLRGVSAVSTAQVLTTGVFDGQAYVVSEYVDGPTLEETGGTPDAVTLYRLAVGTITALVAIHQAGLVHGDIRPGNVLLGPDGPRVVDAGLERALAETTVSTRKVAVPAYTAPERLRGAEPEPPADLFAWAATMVFAAGGSSPFDGGSPAATVARIKDGEPELPELGELHGLIAACLAKDPAARPTASEVLLWLVGQTSLLTGQVPRQAETAPSQRRRTSLLALVAAFVVGALVSGAGVYAVTGTRTPARVAAAVTTTPPATPTITSEHTAAPLAKVEKKATADVELPAIGVTLHEHPNDPVRVASYLESSGTYTSYARDRSGAFKAVSTTEQPAVAPGGDWVALNPMIKFQSSEVDQIKFTRLSTGESFVVSTVRRPLQTMIPVWSRDGGKLLLSVYDDSEQRRLVGFVVVDVTTRKAVYVETEYLDDASLNYVFAPDGTISRGYWDGKRGGIEFYDMSGQVTKTMHWVGLPRGSDWFAPDGKRFATLCPSGKEFCVWDLRTGARRATVPLGDPGGHFLGWFNDQHLMMQDPGKKKGTQVIKVIDLSGATQRVLADLATTKATLLQFARVPGS
ncbi:serine/threonine-protein kinase [Nonomuraea jiangxiensis]|uniref:Serine/threonine protein kinase n=1 Tax=Nonomuraea jiangxiensis TaxID=633440 RepID=A0A1G7Y6L8_9ACTN|nr:serine/threonine-protein kinase [Nonomuraea jiangxiensis]SDG92112.1 Serine/threonine protein kinase [Nonomuraea jiangxiensis]